MVKNKTAERILISLLFAGSVFIAAESRGAEQTHEASLSVTAENERNRDKKQTSEEKGNATVTTMVDTETETCALEIELENSAEQKDTYQLEWYFISKKTAATGGDELVIFDSGKAPVTLEGGASTVKKAASKPFVFTTKNVDSLSKVTGGSGSPRQTRSGDTYAGYIVLVKAGDEVLDSESNSSRFLKDEWLEKCAAFSPKAAPKKK